MRLTVIAKLVLLFYISPSSHATSKTYSTDWGKTTSGETVQEHCLQNDIGMRVCYIDYGATITTIEVPGRDGKLANIVLNLPNLPAYLKTRHRHAAIMGRYAGRIGKAEFTLNGQTYLLPANDKGVALHGDPQGFDKRVWSRQDFDESDSQGSHFNLLSPDGDQGFPGELQVAVTYRLYKARNEFNIEYQLRSDKATVVNLTNHAYFNLAGAGSRGLGTHQFQIHADRYTETDNKRIPTGRILSVDGTALDLRKLTSITGHLERGDAVLGQPSGYDHSLLFTNWDKSLQAVARITETISGRQMDVYTTEPSVQFNSGNGFDGSEAAAYQRHDGFAFETQHLPDSPNHIHFPSTVLNPGEVRTSITSLRFSVMGKPD
ncbi:MAG: galactose mutarotase [Burkholderiales bacterium]|nr:galactose mutarotase [Burkholderiales bacterium]MBI3729279.1 galactose mutarotase [Burkholderiales bacterium]